ncbi:chromo domain protein, partial [Medicago truncatula]
RRKDIEFHVGDHVFLRVNPVTGVGRALKCRKLTPHFIGPFDVIEKVGIVAYRIALPPSLSNLHNVFHVSQLRKFVHDVSHVIQVDELEVRDNMTVETWPVRIDDREMKRLRGKKIVLIKVIWVGPTGESATWEPESRMKVSYPELFPSECRNIFGLNRNGLSPLSGGLGPIRRLSIKTYSYEKFPHTFISLRYFGENRERKWEQKEKRVREKRTCRIKGWEKS